MGTQPMNKRQPTFMRTDDTGPIDLTKVGKAKRNHVLSKATELSGEIASLDDPKVSELYNKLTSELEIRSQSDTQTDVAKKSEGDEADQLRDVKKLLGSKPNTSDVAVYVHSITRELKEICLGVDLKFLAYLIDMARVEADNISAKQR